MGIRQLNAGYIREEDRILLRVSLTEGDELRFWLTRASLHDFLPHMQSWQAGLDVAAAGAGQQAAQAFQREVAAAKADFSQPLVPGDRFPMGEQPMLAVRLALQAQGKVERLQLFLVDKRVVSLNLDGSGVAAILRLLQQTIAAANWGLDAESAYPAAKAGTLH